MRALKLIGVVLHYVVNTLLAALLCALGFLIIILLRDGEAPIPAFVTEALNDELAKQGFRAEFQDLKMDLRGMFFARDVKLYSEGNTEPLFESELLLVKIGIFQALIGDYTPTEVSLVNGAFYCPPVISPRGVREKMIDNIHVHAQRRLSDWEIETFLLELLGARVSVDGNVFTPLPGLEDAPADQSPSNPMGLYVDVCQSLLELEEPFQQVEGLILDLELSSERKGPLNIFANVFHEGFTDPDIELKLGPGSAMLRATLGVDGILRADGLGRAWLDSLHWADDVKTGFTEATVQLGSGLDGFTSMPVKADLYCYDIEAWGLPFDGAFANLDMSRLDKRGSLDGRVVLKSSLNWLSVEGPFVPSDQSGVLTLEARWNPQFFLQTTAIPKEAIPENLEVTGRPYWKAEVHLAPGFKPQWTEFDVRFGELRYEQINLEAARLQGRISQDVIDLHAVSLVASDYEVRGNYWQDIPSGNYRFQAQGTVWPDKLSLFIDEDWWKELWADIQLNQTPPASAIDMSGQYGAEGKKNRIYGWAQLQDVSYKGVPVSRAYTRIWQTPQTLDLFDFTVRTPLGRASANVHFEKFPDGRRKFLSFLARTHLPLVQGATLASEAATPIARKFPAEAPPYLDLAGLVYGEESDRPNELYLKSSVFFPGKFEFEEVRFDNGSFMAEVTPQAIIVSEGRLGLGGGKAALHTIIQRQPDGGLYVQSAKISILDAALHKLYEAIPFLRVAKAKQEALERIKEVRKQAGSNPQPDDERTFEERYAGKVKLFFDTQGQLPDLNSFIGSGTLVLSDANLGQLHLLGGLSSFLYSIGLHLGTLNFDDAQSDFTLARSNIYFPNGQIRGSTGELMANGNFDIENETLDFLIVLHPFGNMETPVVSQIFTVFSPLADSIEVEVTGTLTAPKFDVSVRPLGMFTGKNKVRDKNAGLIQSPTQDVDSANDSQ